MATTSTQRMDVGDVVAYEGEYHHIREIDRRHSRALIALGRTDDGEWVSTMKITVVYKGER